MGVAFYNYVWVGGSNDTFTDAGGAQEITNGLYRFDEFAEAFLATWSLANRRFSLSDNGFVTLDNNGGANFTIAWTDTAVRDFLGFTADLAAANTYTAPRMVRGSFTAVNCTLTDFDPKPSGYSNQRRSRGGLTRSTWQGRLIDQCGFSLFALKNSARLESPAAAVATTYANAAATETGLTEYKQARDHWYDATSASNQGWCDGRPVVFFEDNSDVGFTMTSASSPAWDSLTSGEFSEWVFLKESLEIFGSEKVRPPLTHLYNLSWQAVEHVSP